MNIPSARLTQNNVWTKNSVSTKNTIPAQNIVLVGMMGVGKSTIGRLLAAATDRNFAELDELIERNVGASIVEIFARKGEEAYRDIETKALFDTLEASAGSIISVGGGAVLRQANRDALKAAKVVLLKGSNQVLLSRLGEAEARPVLAGNPAANLQSLLNIRGPIYDEVANISVETDEMTPRQVVDEICKELGLSQSSIAIHLGKNTHPVIVGRGARKQLRKFVPTKAKRVVIVSCKNLPVRYTQDLDCGDLQTLHVVLDDSEHEKSLTTVEALCRQMATFGMTRNDVVVAVGGGVITDAVGLAAAIFHRGASVINIATTLTGQVDAALGGKTGVNIPEGKNLAGVFKQPAAVICDTELLESLPPREWTNGYGEIAKYELLSRQDWTGLSIEDLVAKSVEYKLGVVAKDPREEFGLRHTLNFGHTLGHAIESVGNYQLKHGEAVAVGLLFATLLAVELGRIDVANVGSTRDILARHKLPTEIPDDMLCDELIKTMKRDKKSTGELSFVLDGPNGFELVADVPDSLVRATYEKMVAKGGSK